MIPQLAIPRATSGLCREDALMRLSLYGIEDKRVYLHDFQDEYCSEERGMYLDIMESFGTYYPGAGNQLDS
jgi:hypothetical protein